MKRVEIIRPHPSHDKGAPVYQDRSADEQGKYEVELAHEEKILPYLIIIVETFESAEDRHHKRYGTCNNHHVIQSNTRAYIEMRYKAQSEKCRDYKRTDLEPQLCCYMRDKAEYTVAEKNLDPVPAEGSYGYR